MALDWFQQHASRLRLQRIRDQYQEDDRAKRQGREPVTLPPSPTAAKLSRIYVKRATFCFRYGLSAYTKGPWNDYPSNQIATLRKQWMMAYPLTHSL